jgi:UPF0755 protein
MTPISQQGKVNEFKIPRGSSLREIAKLLEQAKIIKNKRNFIVATYLMFSDKSLKAGRFELSEIHFNFQLIQLLTSPQNQSIRITIQEGLRAREIARIFSSKLHIDSMRFINLLDDESILKEFKIQGNSLEGYLFPNTYDFSEYDSARSVIIKLVVHFFAIFPDSLLSTIKSSTWSLHQILTIASIVEGECRLDDERPIVASVYYNRLRNGMNLEADPTIQYIIPDSPRRLFKKDLELDSPYNTYLYAGLPPGPINNPGLKAIEAAVFPAQTPYLYMVARGDGTHFFTEDYQEFVRAKIRLQRVREQVSEKTKGNNN